MTAAAIPAIPVAGLPRGLPVLVLGTMHMSPDSRDASFALLDAYASAGGSALDTAHVYGGGASERTVGAWLRARGNRDSFTVITKGCHPRAGGGPRVTPEAIKTDITESLERLDAARVDLYLLHRDDPAVPVGPVIEALNREMKAGRISAFGASNWTVERVEEANRWAGKGGLAGFSLISNNLSLAEPMDQIWPGCLSADRAEREWHLRTGLPLLAWSPQARGLFSPRYEKGAPWREDLVVLYDTPANHGRLKRARELAARRGTTANRVALSWVLARDFPVSAVIGPRNPGQLADSLAALDSPLGPTEAAWLEEG